MPDTKSFFRDLGERGHEPLLGNMSGRVRFEVTEGRRTERWFVTVMRGNITVSQDDGEADCVISGDRAVFDDLAAGANAMAAALRGRLSLEGDPSLLVRFQRLFPAPTAPPQVSSDRGVGRRRS